jgi:hypothetical protein
MHEFISQDCLEIFATGSRVICNPAPTDTDQDYVVLVKPGLFWEVIESLADNGYDVGGSQVFDITEETPRDDESFLSWKRGDVNYIVTESKTLFDDFVHATNIAKKLNLLDKQQRIDLFQIILYDNWGD